MSMLHWEPSIRRGRNHVPNAIVADVETSSELEDLHEFTTRLLLRGRTDLSAVEVLSEFQAFQNERHRFLEGLERSRAQAARGEAKPLDVEAFIARLRERRADREKPS
jgi:hypothetical protein